MTQLEKKIANALLKCTFLPGSFDKRFVNQLPNWFDRDMTENGRATMFRLFHKYRRQIPKEYIYEQNHQTLLKAKESKPAG